VVPGVGAFPKAMANLRELGLDAVIHEAARDRVPVLGICLGMQLLFDSSVELGGAVGLGLLPGEVRRLEPGAGRKLPHIGWNLVTLTRPSPLTHGLPDACAFYHVHTFVPVPAREDTQVGTSEYGETFASVVADPEAPVFGVQFHPEKSSAHGLALLENFARVCAPVAA
jgi:imidazole glycerol-phosphate synthase subunit HisH